MKDAATTNEQLIDNNYFYEKIIKFTVVAAVVPHVVVNVTPGMIYQQ